MPRVKRYPNLERELRRQGIRKADLAVELGLSFKALYNKLHGLSAFTWEEACAIQKRFFPNIDKDALFAAPEK